MKNLLIVSSLLAIFIFCGCKSIQSDPSSAKAGTVKIKKSLLDYVLYEDGTVIPKDPSDPTYYTYQVSGNTNTSSLDSFKQIADNDGVLRDVKDIVNSNYSYAALKNDGTLVSWGKDITKNGKLRNVKQVVANSRTFTVLLNNNSGTVVSWDGNKYVTDESETIPATETTNATDIFSTSNIVAALKKDRTVFIWGYYTDEENRVKKYTRSLGSDVDKVVVARNGLAILQKNGAVVTQGYDATVNKATLTNVKEVVATDDAFAALKTDGSVIIWGNEQYGGWIEDPVNIVSGITKIVSTSSAFAALKEKKGTRSVIAWGDKLNGGNPEYESEYLVSADEDLTNVNDIFAVNYGTHGAFIAIKDGKYIPWGDKAAVQIAKKELNLK